MRSNDLELKSYATELLRELRFTTGWQIEAFRNASLSIPNWILVSKDGTVIDIDGLVPGLLGPVRSSFPGVYERPTTIQSSLGERWRVFGRQLDGGSGLVGILQTQSVCDADARLARAADRFGSSVREAVRVKERDFDWDIQTAILSDSGEVLRAFGGLPLQFAPVSDFTARFLTVDFAGERKRIYRFPVLSDSGTPEGLAFLPKDISQNAATLRTHLFFVLFLTILGLLGSVILVLQRELALHRKHLSLDEALKAGESETIEFKASFDVDVKNSGVPLKVIRLETVRSVAAFLNSERGGQVFIGVTDKGNREYEVRGLREDLKKVHDDHDTLILKISDVLSEFIEPSSSALRRIRFEPVEKPEVVVIDVRPSQEETYVKEGDKYQTYIRDGNKTQLLDSKGTMDYFKKKRRRFR